MIGFLYRWIIGSFYICQHKWKARSLLRIKDQDDFHEYDIYTLECEKCGEITSRKVK